MKNPGKISVAVLIGVSLINAAFKITETKANNFSKIDELAIAKQIGISLNRVVANGIDGFKTDSKHDLYTPQFSCGAVTRTGNNGIAIIKDTTRKTEGRSIFTYVCNNAILNAYTLADTLSVTDTGIGFNNSKQITQNYMVTLDGANLSLSHISGIMTMVNSTEKINSSHTTTKSGYLSAQYKLSDVLVKRAANSVKIVSGGASFNSQYIDKETNTSANGNNTTLAGKIVCLGDGSVRVIFDEAGGIDRVYLVNLQTGETMRIIPG